MESESGITSRNNKGGMVCIESNEISERLPLSMNFLATYVLMSQRVNYKDQNLDPTNFLLLDEP